MNRVTIKLINLLDFEENKIQFLSMEAEKAMIQIANLTQIATLQNQFKAKEDEVCVEELNLLIKLNKLVDIYTY